MPEIIPRVEDEPGSPLRPIEKVAVTEQIISRLKTYIAQQHVAVGAKFPSERQLASMLKVSRHSIREALRVLEVLGVLKPTQGKGTYLVSRLPKPLNRPDQILGLQESVDIVELWEVRAAFEPSVAALAALRATDEDLRLTARQLEGMRNNLKNSEAFAKYDLEFHLCLARACGNDVLEMTTAPLIKVFFDKAAKRRLLDYSRDVPRRYGELRNFLKGHEQIFDALRRHNPTLARSRMMKHMRAVGEYDVRLVRAMATNPEFKMKRRSLVAL
ncbi:MAG TPA: FadR/GntR family transcriptional regulator [Terriglobia bacterium]|nr:FadR/GntR family transcriptional regulator [Terriglobia bacterium]